MTIDSPAQSLFDVPSPTSNPSTPSIISISTHQHLPIELTTSNYPSWRAHLLALLNGYALSGFLTGETVRPDSSTDPSAVSRWFQQDQLLLAAIIGSVSADILPLISTESTAAGAWSTLNRAFASTSRARVNHLKSELSRAAIGSRSMHHYVHFLKSKANELALIGERVHDDDLTLFIINGLGPNYREIAMHNQNQDNQRSKSRPSPTLN